MLQQLQNQYQTALADKLTDAPPPIADKLSFSRRFFLLGAPRPGGSGCRASLFWPKAQKELRQARHPWRDLPVNDAIICKCMNGAHFNELG
ncbi:MAG: hypothetical protein CFE24_02300 [Flavobacterium sp. BFFFF2]|nr:MAG: hypothetical protein CFE24_02300 [Flavobacterium sp. BFFFF2]